MAEYRTELQIAADRADSALFRLISHAITASENTKYSRGERGNWQMIAETLSEARPYARKMMHKDDRAAT